MKKTLLRLAGISLALVSVSSGANDEQSGNDAFHNYHEIHGYKTGKAHGRIDADWVTALNLQGDRAEQVRELQEAFGQRRDEQVDDHHRAMKQLKEERRQALAHVLTPEELERLEIMWRAHGNHPARYKVED